MTHTNTEPEMAAPTIIAVCVTAWLTYGLLKAIAKGAGHG